MKNKISYDITVSHPIICVTCLSAGKFIPKEFWNTTSDVKNAKDVNEEIQYRVIVDEAA